MKKFLDENFLLSTKTARKLYQSAKVMPIFDYHCHLSPQEIWENKQFRSITEVWLGGDHYKWRLMRALGVSEEFITGSKSDWEKFQKWAEVMPSLIGNPLYHWTHLELKRFFGINQLLNPRNAKPIYDQCNKILETLTARKLITMSDVTCLFTTDDPIDDLKYHQLLSKDDTFTTKVLPAFRADKVINIDAQIFLGYIDSLSSAAGIKISNVTDLENALIHRIDHFHQNGCRASDHGLDTIEFIPATRAEVDAIFTKRINGEAVTVEEVKKYKGYVMVFLGKQYHQRGWVQEYHIGALRDVSDRMYQKLGPNTGYDAINDGPVSKPLSSLLNALDKDNCLPKTIVFGLNPRDNELIATIIAGFQSGASGKMQYGAAWWFNDQKDGMLRQMEALAQNGVLATFVGMLTDSRSFLSYTRHEYFRRLLCDKIGSLVENGEYPADWEQLKKIVCDICYNNAFHYFGITLK